MIAGGEHDTAAAIARLAVRTATGDERAELVAILGQLASAPSGWLSALET